MSTASWLDQPFCNGPSSATPSPPPVQRRDSSRPSSSATSGSLSKLPTSGTQDVFNSIVNGRKSWKTLRGGEVVWPPELEAALLEGLESYQPDDSRETRLLGRFPLRNRFISDFIYQKTGKRRTAKQVGSRLQQLRDTCGGKQLLSLLSPCRKPGVRPSNYFYRSSSSHDSESSDTSSPSSPVSPTDPHHHLHHHGMWSQKRRQLSPCVIYVDILPEERYPPASTSSHHTASTPGACSSSSAQGGGVDDTHVVRLSSQPRLMRSIDPTVTFLARAPVSASSTFTVSLDGMIVHSETTTLTQRTEASQQHGGSCLYSTNLAPNYWKNISESRNPTRYTILQEVILHDDTNPDIPLFSAVYKFRYPSSSSQNTSTSSGAQPSFSSAHSTHNAASFVDDCTSSSGHPCGGVNSGSGNFPAVTEGGYYTFDDAQFECGWDMGSWTPPSDGTSSSDYPSPPIWCDERRDSLGSISQLSPTSACFPSDISNYVL